jgi:hypothetical protein
MGVVTDVYCPPLDEGSVSNRPFRYDVDDGTGIIKVFLSLKTRVT